jgi:hypothetical protein
LEFDRIRICLAGEKRSNNKKKREREREPEDNVSSGSTQTLPKAKGEREDSMGSMFELVV